MQVHLVQLSTTQVSFSAKNRPSCQQADTFLVLGGPPISSQRTWLSLDWKIEGRLCGDRDNALMLLGGRGGSSHRQGARPWPAGGESGPREASAHGVTSRRPRVCSRGWSHGLRPRLFLPQRLGAQPEAVSAGGGGVQTPAPIPAGKFQKGPSLLWVLPEQHPGCTLCRPRSRGDGVLPPGPLAVGQRVGTDILPAAPSRRQGARRPQACSPSRPLFPAAPVTSVRHRVLPSPGPSWGLSRGRVAREAGSGQRPFLSLKGPGTPVAIFLLDVPLRPGPCGRSSHARPAQLGDGSVPRIRAVLEDVEPRVFVPQSPRLPACTPPPCAWAKRPVSASEGGCR